MRPLRLILKNFKGIRKPVLDIDIEALAGSHQLIAIKGANGAGKTTILDNMHPYRLMPSRASTYSPGSFSFYDHVNGPEASKELIFEHGGVVYRSFLLFKVSGKTRKTEAYLSHDGVPYTLPDGVTSDGKTETYDMAVEHLMGSPALYFTSAFAAQGRRTLSDYTNGEIKALLSDLLDLDHIRSLGKQAADVAKDYRAKVVTARATVESLAAKQAMLAAEETALGNHKREREQAQAILQTQKSAIATAMKEVANAQARMAAQDEIASRRDAIMAQIAAAKQRAKETASVFDNQAAQLSRSQTEKAMAIAKDRKRIADLEGAIKSADATLAMTAQIEAAQVARETLVGILAEADAALTKAHAADKERAVLQGRLNSIKSEGQSLRAQSVTLIKQSELATVVPCLDTDLQPKCPLLKDALTAKARLSDVQAQIDAKTAEYKEVAAAVAASVSVDVLQAQTAQAKARQAVVANDALIAKAPLLDQAQRTKAQAKAQIIEAEAQITEAQAHIEAAKKEAASVAAAAIAAAKAQETEVADLAAQLANMPEPVGEAEYERAQKAVARLTAEADVMEQAIASAISAMAVSEERIRVLAGEVSGAAAASEALAALELEVSYWLALTKALGNDGIIALAIDDAGPTIAALANDILMRCYGQRFSVSLRTQVETQKGELRETFDIIVFDAESVGGSSAEKSISLMSGGERVWLNECLARAIALYQGQMSGQKYQTLFADESDGALDTSKKEQFVKMKRTVLELGGYEREIFITHTPELWDLADVVIDVERL